MIIGILSDTHGDYEIANIAVKLLLDHGATALVHCGDVGDRRVLDALAGTPSFFVFGNNDYDYEDLERYGNQIGVGCLQFGGGWAVDGKYIAITHGDNARTVHRFLEPANKADYLLTGHTHVRHDQRVGSTRWINPGALYRAKTKSVALLDLAADELTFLDVVRG